MTSPRQHAGNSYTVAKAARPINLLIILIAQLLFYYHFHVLAEDFDYVLLILATLLSAAAGNIINDIKDLKADLINKPHKVWIGNKIKPTIAWVIYWTIFFAASILALLVSVKAYFYVTCIQVLLYVYSMWLSKVPFIGNVLVSALTAMVIIIIPMLFLGTYDQSYWFLAGIAFGLNLIREILKDLQDQVGDRELGRYTLPILIGEKATLAFLTALVISSAVVLDVLVYNFRHYLQESFSDIYLFLSFFILVLAPMHLLAYYIVQCFFRPKNVKLAARFVKLIMFGALSWWALALFVI